ncbi:22371_t:CDS:2 [Racocetra persica]|uniref:22371_t:CDS:1 n=1 Tax=Racocetra persica TaxID=160502 RepID=A0ACA9KEA8_9GLOM|nr:22371_t:CDS:2 [Racocetra persica]
MFKKFNIKEDVATQSLVKTSVQRSIRSKILEQYKKLEPFDQQTILFFQHFDGPYYPTLRLLHKYPDAFPRLQVDRGAIKFILSGANIMCPGLTSKGARMDEDLPTDTIVGVFAEGKEHALAIGLTKMSTEDIKKINKNIGVENVHYLNDPLWKSFIEA